MHARPLALAGFALLTTSCDPPPTERDAAKVKIDYAYALSISADDMGGPVLPDRFQFYVEAWEPAGANARQKDFFRASLNVGTDDANPSKYGGLSGLKFTITSVPLVNPAFNFTAYTAVSEAVEISCDAQNRLRFSVAPGPSVDDLQLRLKTAAMANHFLAFQNGTPRPSLFGYNPTGFAKQTVRYNCNLERQP